MFKLLHKIFIQKPPKIDHAEHTGMERMSRMRRKTDEIVIAETESDEAEEKRDLLTRARDAEIGESWKTYSFKGKEENERRMGSIIRDWKERVRHLPGFEVDPQY